MVLILARIVIEHLLHDLKAAVSAGLKNAYFSQESFVWIDNLYKNIFNTPI